MSVELTEWAELASTVKSPVGSNLASLLRSLSQLSDAELLSLELPVVQEKIVIWNSLRHGFKEALELPEGFLVVGCFQVDVKRETLKQAVDCLLPSLNGQCVEATTQAEIIKKAFPDTYR